MNFSGNIKVLISKTLKMFQTTIFCQSILIYFGNNQHNLDSFQNPVTKLKQTLKNCCQKFMSTVLNQFWTAQKLKIRLESKSSQFLLYHQQ